MITRFNRILSILLLVLGVLTIISLRSVDAEENKTIPRDTKAIRLVVNASTWREGKKPFEIYRAVSDKLEQVGFKVVTEESYRYDTDFKVTYSEYKGREYTFVGCCGTHISFEANINLSKLYPAQKPKIMKVLPDDTWEVPRLTSQALNELFRMEDGTRFSQITLKTFAMTPWVVKGLSLDALYSAALDEFNNDFEFKYLGEIISYALGDKSQSALVLQGLLENNVDRRMRLRLLLNSMNYVPKNDEERAMFAIAALQYNECKRIGKPAIKPLVKMLKTRDRGLAADILGEIGDVTVIKPLQESMAESPPYKEKCQEAIQKIMDRK